MPHDIPRGVSNGQGPCPRHVACLHCPGRVSSHLSTLTGIHRLRTADWKQQPWPKLPVAQGIQQAIPPLLPYWMRYPSLGGRIPPSCSIPAYNMPGALYCYNLTTDATIHRLDTDADHLAVAAGALGTSSLHIRKSMELLHAGTRRGKPGRGGATES